MSAPSAPERSTDRAGRQRPASGHLPDDVLEENWFDDRHRLQSVLDRAIRPETLIGRGGRRNVHAIPGDPGRVVKIQHWSALEALLTRRFSFFLRECSGLSENDREAFWLRRASKELPLPRFFAKTRWNGRSVCLVERIGGNREALHPIEYVRRGGSLAETRDAIHRSIEQLIAHRIACADLRLGNVMMARRDGRLCAFVVDGLGSNKLWPYWIFSRALNERHLRRRLARMDRRLIDKTGRNK